VSVDEIAPGVFRLEEDDGGRRLCQALVRGHGASLVVDAGLPGSPTRGLLPLLGELGAGDDPVLLVLTHPDADHVGGAAELRAALGRLTICAGDPGVTGDPEATLAARGGDRVRMAARLGAPFAVDLIPAGDLVFGVGGRTVEVIRLPGHSPGHLGVWLPAERVAVIGDAVMGDGVPLRDGSLLYPPMYAPPSAYRATIARLEELAPALLVTGHFPLLAGPEVAAFLATSRAACDRMERIVRDAPTRELDPLCAWAHEAWGSLPAGARDAIAMTVAGHLDEDLP
jgi:glyoxylase-like metal-dependent hydrolase (beta-lactamase superfamily II)